ncbi:hypothetical protein NFI96_027588 [Prochilodus magdalenae]|nr:hypothetical protein NFI96_027588 [Prochilodus magdalenae]
MASIVSSLDEEKEMRLLSLFPQPVRLHLLYRSSHHGASISTLLSRFDEAGKFVVVVFPQFGDVRGGFTSRSLKAGREFDDGEAFVFEIKEKARRFSARHSAKAVEVRYADLEPVADLASLQVEQLHIYSREAQGHGLSSYRELLRIGGYSCELFASASIQLWVARAKQRALRGCGAAPCSRSGRSSTPPLEGAVLDRGRYSDSLFPVITILTLLLSREPRQHHFPLSRKSLRESFVSYKPILDTLPQVRALLLGPVGSGKSSLINSIRSTMYRRIIHLPNVGTATGSFTKKLKSYDIRAEKGASPTALCLCDVMAIRDKDFTGLSLSDTLAVIKGHVPDGYQFQSESSISDKVSGYRAAPTLEDQIHCVLFVLDASKVDSYSSSLQTTIGRLRTTISDLGIPQLVVLTHVDKVSCAVKESVKHVYSSRALQEKMQKAAELVGLPLSYVLPVKNYISQLSVDLNTDILLLSAFNTILQAVDDMLEDQYPADVIILRQILAPPNSSIGVVEL